MVNTPTCFELSADYCALLTAKYKVESDKRCQVSYQVQLLSMALPSRKAVEALSVG